MRQMKYYVFFKQGSYIRQIICAILINWSVFAYGTSIGWMSPMTLLLQSDQSPRGTPFSVTEISWIAAIGYMSSMVWDVIVGLLGDWMGRKKTILFVSVSAVVAWSIKLSSYEAWALILARCILGILMAGSYVTCPSYTKEISDDTIRGVLGSFVILFHVSGNLFLYIVGDILSYRNILWVCFALPAVHVVLFLMMPESPSYLVKQEKYEEAAKAIAWLKCREETDPEVEIALEQLKKEQQVHEKSSNFAIKALMQDKILFRAFRIAIVISLAREVCGTNPVLNFAGDIFADASEGTGLVLTPNQQAMMLGGVQVAGSLVASCVVERTGRKPLFIGTAFISGIGMLALGSWFVARDSGVWTPAWLPIVTLCLCIFCDASGLQPVSVLINGEMFSFKYRGTVMAATMSLASIVAFLQTLFFKPIAVAMGSHISFYFFAFVCIFAAVYAFLFVPETKLRTVEEIQEDLKTKKEKELERLKTDEKVCKDKFDALTNVDQKCDI